MDNSCGIQSVKLPVFFCISGKLLFFSVFDFFSFFFTTNSALIALHWIFIVLSAIYADFNLV